MKKKKENSMWKPAPYEMLMVAPLKSVKELATDTGKILGVKLKIKSLGKGLYRIYEVQD